VTGKPTKVSNSRYAGTFLGVGGFSGATSSLG
jgi:hypothetical protein